MGNISGYHEANNETPAKTEGKGHATAPLRDATGEVALPLCTAWVVPRTAHALATIYTTVWVVQVGGYDGNSVMQQEGSAACTELLSLTMSGYHETRNEPTANAEGEWHAAGDGLLCDATEEVALWVIPLPMLPCTTHKATSTSVGSAGRRVR